MLKSKYCSWNKQGCLLAVCSSLESGPDSHLGLAKADVAAHQPVHGHRRLHIFLDRYGAGHLVGSILPDEGGLKLSLKIRVGGEGKAAGGLSFCVELDEITGNILDLFPGGLLHLLPGAGAQLVDTRRCVIPALIL